MNMSLNNISKGNYAKRIHCGYDDAIGYDLSISSNYVRDKRNGLLGRYKFTKEYLNCTSDVVLVAERTGIVVPLYPTPEHVAERYKVTPVNGKGVYIVLRFNTNGWNARHIFEYFKVFDEMSESEKKTILDSNPIMLEFYQRIRNRWAPYFSNRKPARNYESLLDGEVCDDMVFFISEEDIRNRQVLYDNALDISLTFDDISHKRAYHPAITTNSQSIPSEIFKMVKDTLDKNEQLESIRLVSANPIVMYRKFGKYIQKFSSREPLPGEKEGLHYIGTADDENGNQHVVNEFIELDDRNKLSELSIFRTYDEARNYNSDVELTKLKTKHEMEMMELKKEITVLENKHKEELAKAKNQEFTLKLKEFIEDAVHKRLMREMDHREKMDNKNHQLNERLMDALDRNEEREYKLDERISDRQYKLRERILDQNDRIQDLEHKRNLRQNDIYNSELTLRMKIAELESKLGHKQLENERQISNNWLSAISGISSILGTVFKLFGTATASPSVSKLGTALQMLSSINPQTINQVRGMFG